jgi:hypothetical protein
MKTIEKTNRHEAQSQVAEAKIQEEDNLRINLIKKHRKYSVLFLFQIGKMSNFAFFFNKIL